ncbi:unnamed protein product [Orchesella dallaii]|uniref:Nose resistant to fluoxetine protein 6 n=1 Tax=Orchesella dallaii TaxID=48710 RepID=A0ABP1QZV5_9HEXA
MIRKGPSPLITAFDKLSSKFGVFAANFNAQTQTFHPVPSQEWRVTLNYALSYVWALGASCIIVKYKRRGELDRYNMTLAYWMAGTLAIVIYSIIRFYTKDLCRVANGFSQFIQYIYKTYHKSFDPDTCKAHQYFNILLKLVVVLMAASYLLMVLFLIYDPRGVVFLGDLVPEECFIVPIHSSKAWKVYLNYVLLHIWAVGSFGIVVKYKRRGDIDRYNITLAYWLAGILVTMLHSIFQWYTKDLVIMANGFFKFIRYMHDPSQAWRVSLNYVLLHIWAAGAFGIVVKYKRRGDIDRYNITLAYWLAGVLATIVYSIIQWHTKDLVIMANGFFKFIRYMHDSSQAWRVSLNYVLLHIWAVGSFGIVVKYKRRGDIDRYNITLAYWLAGVLATIAYSLIQWHTKDLKSTIQNSIQINPE